MIYAVRCPCCQREEDIVRSVAERDANLPRCHGREMRRILTVPHAYVKADVRYRSPVDGRPITNEQEHREELARTSTVVYEPGIKQDQERNELRRASALERSIDETVEREIAIMPSHKRERLAAELDNGASAVATRTEN